MITDRISLNLIYIYLDQFQSNQGPLDNIQISVRKILDKNTKTINFSSLDNLEEFIEEFAPISSIYEMQCRPMSLMLFELKSFNTIVDYGETNSNKNTISSTEREFDTRSRNIHRANLDILNKSYMPLFLETMKGFNNFAKNEYILHQIQYIDCKYIEVYFKDQLNEIIKLYKKYKNKY
jgi:hypothetical protein